MAEPDVDLTSPDGLILAARPRSVTVDQERRVLVVDDEADMRELLAIVIGREEELTVVGLASSADEALAAANQHRPDAIVLDVMMPERSGLSILPELRSTLPETNIVLFTAVADAPAVRAAAAEWGVRAIEKTGWLGDLLAALRHSPSVS